jgi:hypothetical protein
MRRDLQSINGLFPEKRRCRCLVGILGGDHGLHPGDFGLKCCDVAAQFVNPSMSSTGGTSSF